MRESFLPLYWLRMQVNNSENLYKIPDKLRQKYSKTAHEPCTIGQKNSTHCFTVHQEISKTITGQEFTNEIVSTYLIGNKRNTKISHFKCRLLIRQRPPATFARGKMVRAISSSELSQCHNGTQGHCRACHFDGVIQEIHCCSSNRL